MALPLSYQRAGPLALPSGSMSGLRMGAYQGIPMSLEYLRRMATPAPPPQIPILPPMPAAGMMGNAPAQVPPLPPVPPMGKPLGMAGDVMPPPKPARPFQGPMPSFASPGFAMPQDPMALAQTGPQPIPSHQGPGKGYMPRLSVPTGQPGPVPAGPVQGVNVTMTPREKDLLARIVAFEAGNQDDLGRQAVAHVAMNRLASGEFGGSMWDVLTAENQFEPWMTKRDELLGLSPDSEEYKRSLAAIEAAVSGPDPTKGATFFLNPEIVKKRRKDGSLPDWATGETAVIGQHTFYNPNGLLLAGESGSDYLGGGGAEDTLGGYESTAAGMIDPIIADYRRDNQPVRPAASGPAASAAATRRTAPPIAPAAGPASGDLDARIEQIMQQQRLYALSQGLSQAGVALASGAPWGAALASLGNVQQPGMDLGMLLQLEQLKRDEAEKASQQEAISGLGLDPRLPGSLLTAEYERRNPGPQDLIRGNPGDQFFDPNDPLAGPVFSIPGDPGTAPETWGEPYFDQGTGKWAQKSSRGQVRYEAPTALEEPKTAATITERNWSTLINGDPASPEYALAYREEFQVPKYVTNESGQVVPITVPAPPNVRPPTYAAPAGGATGAAPAVGPQAGAAIEGTGKPTTEFERASASFTNRMEAAAQVFSQIESTGGKTTEDYWQGVLDMDPTGMGRYVQSPEYQQYVSAQMDWVRAKLRKESGAVIGDVEMADEIRTYFPQPGDSKEVIAQKARQRALAEQGMRMMAGKAYQPYTPPPADAQAVNPEDPLGLFE